MKGTSVFLGYFKDPELTAKTIDEDGWLRVGDLAVLHDNGAIEIIERVDELKKLQNGEYIAPQKIEAIYVNVPLIE